MRLELPPSTSPRRAVCTGEGDGEGRHCCYVAGERCPNLVENVNGRRYACGVVVKYGSWEAANTAPEYASIGKNWLSIGKPWNYCEVFDPALCCRSEMKPEEALNGDLGT